VVDNGSPEDPEPAIGRARESIVTLLTQHHLAGNANSLVNAQLHNMKRSFAR
jgi:hypothetical protein